MATTQWGRRESVIFPPHGPVYSYGAIFIAFLLTLVFVYLRYAYGQTPLQQHYTVAYVRSAVGGVFKMKGTYRLIYVAGGKDGDRLATAADVLDHGAPGSRDGLALSTVAIAHGARYLYPAAEQTYNDAPLHDYLRLAVFAGNRLNDIYRGPLLLGLLSLVVQLPFSVAKDVVRRKEIKYGRRLKGPVMLSPKDFKKAVRGDGIGFKTVEAKAMMRIPMRAEAQHMEIMGDTGAGKTALIMQVLRQVQARGHSAIVYDPACEFVQRFYDQRRGDIVLNPLDDRCPYWGPSEELRRKAEAKAIAASLYQPTSDKKGEFFVETPQKIFAHLLTYGPTPQELIAWLSNPVEIDRRVQGTEMEAMVARGAQQQRNGVLASLGLVADSLRLLPTKEQARGQTWSATEWSKERRGWIFLTSSPTEREALRPLHSLWIDLLVMRLLSAPNPNQKPVWFVLDELASLQRLPQLHTAITENRKSKNPLVLGMQGKAQLEVIYGHLAEVMLSQPATKIFLKTTEPKAAEWVSNAIGKVEIERMKETHFDGRRSGKNFALDRQTDPLVMDSEISGLENRHAFLKLGNNVARFSFEYMDVPITAPAFVPRQVEDDELPFDPKTLLPRVSTVREPLVDLEADPPRHELEAADEDPSEFVEEDLVAENVDPDVPEDKSELQDVEQSSFYFQE